MNHKTLLFFCSCSLLISGCTQLSQFDRLAPSNLNSVASGIGQASNPNATGLNSIDMHRAVDAAKDLGKAVTLSEKEVKGLAKQFISHSDRENRVAPAGSAYAKRLRRLTQKHTREGGLNLNFKVYLSPQLNAFATADGSIRIYSGLMDIMNDEELRSVIGHEIAHVKLKHIDRATRLSYSASALRKGVAAGNTIAGVVAESEIGGMAESFLNAQFSQSQELDSDEDGLGFLVKHGYNPQGAVSAMQKLGKLSKRERSLGEKLLSSHPVSERRVAALQTQIAELDIPASRNSQVADSSQLQSDTEEFDAIDEQAASAPVQTASLTSATLSASSTSTSTEDVQESAVTSGAWYVQLSAETEEDIAKSNVEKLLSDGQPTELQSAVVNDVRYYRVLIGPFRSQAQARAKLGVARASGLADGEPFVRRLE